MKDWRNKYQVLFITLISFWALIFPTYCLFYSLDEVDMFCSPRWEKPDQEDLLADVQDVEEELIGVGWNLGAFIVPQRIEFFRLFPDLSLNPLSIKRIPVLRC